MSTNDTSVRAFEYKQEQARVARQEASELRELHFIANCGLDIRINYGTKYVPQHIAMRIADQFPIWADEYEALAARLDRDMQQMLGAAPDSHSTGSEPA